MSTDSSDKGSTWYGNLMIDHLINIKAVGDISPGDFSARGLGVYSISKKYGTDYLFENIKSQLKDCDILLGNLEYTLSQHSFVNADRHPGRFEIAKSLRDVGFDVLSIANNHSYDYGSEVFKETVSYCEKAGIKICGLRGKGKYYSQPVILERNSNIKVGILAYNWIGLENDSDIGEYIAIVKDSIVNYTWNRNQAKDMEAQAIIHKKNQDVINDIKMLRKEVDILILMPHWGYEWTHYPPYGVVLEARNYMDCGVDLIVGSHPHVPQGVEKYNNGLIIYSLGNFLFDSIIDKFQYGMMVNTKITPSKVVDYEMSFVKRGRHHRPEPATEKDTLENMNFIEQSNNAIASADARHKLDDELIYHEFERKYKNLRYQKIFYLFLNMFKHPFLIKFIFKKIFNLFHLIIMRLSGKKIRW